MTIDERLEAITMNLELLSHEREKDNERITAQGQNIDRLEKAVVQLTGIAGKTFESIQGLIRTAEIHERRLTQLEGGEA